MKKIFLCLFFLFGPLCSLIGKEEIIVDLFTQEHLSPFYVASFDLSRSQLSHEYIQKLETLLQSDLIKNGKVRLLPKTAERDNFAFSNSKNVRSIGANGIIRGSVIANTLSITIYNTQTHQIQGIEGISLTNNLNLDRRKIHILADTITSAFFRIKGIASSHLLYSLTKKESSSSKNWKTEIWECDSDGANARQLTHDSTICMTPYYIPDETGHSKAFLYISYKHGQPKLFAASLKDGMSKRITLLPGNQLTPAISPKGNFIAFVCDATGNPELYLLPFNLLKGALGKPRIIFSSLSGAQGCPCFSPDESQIAFVSNKDGKPRIYVMDIPQHGTGKPWMITKKNRDNTSPAWSPDGTKIAYSALTEGVRQIWIFDFRKDQEYQLTFGKEHKENPSWGSNSFHIIYNTSTDQGGDLYLINLDDKNPFKITTGSGEKRFPCFEPKWSE